MDVLKAKAADGVRVSATLIYHHGSVDVLATAQQIKTLEASLPTAASSVPIIACLPPFTPPNFDSALCNRLCSVSVRYPIILSSLHNALDTVLCSVRAERVADSRPASSTGTPTGTTTSRTLAGVKSSSSPPLTPRTCQTRLPNGSPMGSVQRQAVMANTSPAVRRAERAVQRPTLFKQLASQYPLDILIVEDNPVNMKLLRKMLANIGYDDCQQAGDGMQAVRLIEDERQHFDLIFMDCIMPVMGGIDCTKRLLQFYKELGTNAVDVPVIVAMTASAMDEDKKECMGAGMREFVSKPVNAARLQDVITVWGKEIVGKRNGTQGSNKENGCVT